MYVLYMYIYIYIYIWHTHTHTHTHAYDTHTHRCVTSHTPPQKKALHKDASLQPSHKPSLQSVTPPPVSERGSTILPTKLATGGGEGSSEGKGGSHSGGEGGGAQVLRDGEEEVVVEFTVATMSWLQVDTLDSLVCTIALLVA
jgi:hypothetical protein